MYSSFRNLRGRWPCSPHQTHWVLVRGVCKLMRAMMACFCINVQHIVKGWPSQDMASDQDYSINSERFFSTSDTSGFDVFHRCLLKRRNNGRNKHCAICGLNCRPDTQKCKSCPLLYRSDQMSNNSGTVQK